MYIKIKEHKVISYDFVSANSTPDRSQAIESRSFEPPLNNDTKSTSVSNNNKFNGQKTEIVPATVYPKTMYNSAPRPYAGVGIPAYNSNITQITASPTTPAYNYHPGIPPPGNRPYNTQQYTRSKSCLFNKNE